MVIYGRQPSPRALILGFSDTVAEQLAGLFPTAKRVSDLDEVRQSEWDVLVTSEGVPPRTSPHLYVVGVGGSEFGRTGRDENHTWARSTVKTIRTVVAHEFRLGGELSSSMEQLTKRNLIPEALQLSEHPTIVDAIDYGNVRTFPDEVLRPFLLTSGGEVLACEFQRRGNSSICWVLPLYADPVLWARLALSEWEHIDNVRFPRVDPWRARSEWRTAREIQLETELTTLRAARERANKEFDASEDDLLLRMEESAKEADQRERRLLTERGENLVAAVIEALEALGFNVQNMDNVFPETDRREDLRVTHGDFGNWVAIVEVRGYKGGAAVSDLLRLGRFARRYLAEEGREPDAVWYIVNQFITRDPSTRQQILTSNPDELAVFIDDAGLAIDTVDLFRLWTAVQDQRISPKEARQLLRNAIGRFEYPQIETR